MVQVTHRVDTIVPEMQRVIFLDGGTIVKSGSPAELLRPKGLSNLFKTQLEVVKKNGFVHANNKLIKYSFKCENPTKTKL